MADTRNLVLVPGLVCDFEIWRHQLDHLSDVAEIFVPNASMGETMAEMASIVLDEAPDQFALAGFSMGGYVALEMLRQAPDRITRLAVLDTSATADTPEKSAGRQTAIAACENGEYDQIIANMLTVLLHPGHQKEPYVSFVKAMAARVGAEVFARRHRAMMTRTDSRDLLKATNIPVRAICGRQDAMSPVEGHEEMANLAPNGRLSIIEECGHMTIFERPQAATSLLRDWFIYD